MFITHLGLLPIHFHCLCSNVWRDLGHESAPIEGSEARSLGGHTEIIKDFHFQNLISVSWQFNLMVVQNSILHRKSPAVCLPGVPPLPSHGCPGCLYFPLILWSETAHSKTAFSSPVTCECFLYAFQSSKKFPLISGAGLFWGMVMSAIAFGGYAQSLDQVWPGKSFTFNQVIKGSQRTF